MTLTILAIFQPAKALAANEESFGYATSCHQNNTIAFNLCAVARDALNPGSWTCKNEAGGVSLENDFHDTISHFYYSAEAGATFCESEFEQENQNTQLLLAVNDDLAAAEQDISNLYNSDSLQNTRLDQIDTVNGQQDQSIITLNAEQNLTEQDVATLQNRAALIEIDINANQFDIGQLQTDLNSTAFNLQSGINSNAGAIQFNELYIEGVEAQQNTYETTRAASDAVTNSLVSQSNTHLASINNYQALFAPKYDAMNSSLTSINNYQGLFAPKYDTMNAALEAIRASQVSTENAVNNVNISQQAKLNEIKNAIESQSFEISGENINIDNSGVEGRLDNVLSKQDLQQAELVSANSKLDDVVVAVTYDPTVENESITNEVYNYLNSLWSQDVSDYETAIQVAMSEAQLDNAGLDTTDIEIIGNTAIGFAAAQSCVDHTFDFGPLATFQLYCVRTSKLRELIGWAFYIITAFVLFDLMMSFKPTKAT